MDGKTRKEEHGVAAKRRIVVIDWVDGDVSDSDEVAVVAESNADAVKKAIGRWAAKTIAKWPNCVVEKVEVLTTARLRGFA
ncbi:MAG: hypothetical protein EBR82_38080 [Caulobacteraceae bacterium]|nr:hypothetical protein [Caulobacteraceae bacterium]